MLSSAQMPASITNNTTTPAMMGFFRQNSVKPMGYSFPEA